MSESEEIANSREAIAKIVASGIKPVNRGPIYSDIVTERPVRDDDPMMVLKDPELRMKRLLVRKILEKPHGFDWSIQGLGMLRLYLSREVRLHIWNPQPPYKLPNVSELHSHPWHFTSTVVVGWLINHIYWPDEDGALFSAGTIECGPNPKKKGAENKRDITLFMRSERVLLGGSYAMDAETIHRSEPCPGTVTLCDRVPLEDPDHATVCWPHGTEWVSAEPRPATTDEVYSITKTALALMAEEGAR